jgi:S-adenosylmethionine hydrolase
MSRSIITLTTDFGTESPYVASMKGSILSVDPDAQVIDVTHSIEPQNIRAAAIVVEQIVRTFPQGSIHIAVVDPGVGTEREILCVECEGQIFIAPDNGLLSRLARRSSDSKIVAVREERYWCAEVSRTFHGRDIMAPVAAHLGLGVDPNQLGPVLDRIVELEWEEALKVPGNISGKVEEVDSFGNLITNITREQLADVPRDESVTIDCDGHQTQGIYETYGEQSPMTLIALIGSSDMLELAIVDDSAKIMLGTDVDATITITW